MILPTYEQLMGAPKLYTASALWTKFVEYVNDNKSDTMERVELLKAGDKAGEQAKCDLKVPLSIVGFCVYANINRQTFYNYSNIISGGKS